MDIQSLCSQVQGKTYYPCAAKQNTVSTNGSSAKGSAQPAWTTSRNEPATSISALSVRPVTVRSSANTERNNTGPASFLERVQTAYDFSRDVAQIHQESGVAVEEGLRRLGSALNLFQSVQIQSQAARPSPASSPDKQAALQTLGTQQLSPASGDVQNLISQIGSRGQNAALLEAGQQIADYAQQQWGINFAQASAEEILGQVYNELFGSPQPAAAQGAGAAASSAAAGTSTAPVSSTAETGANILSGIGALWSGFQLIDSLGASNPQTGAVQGFTVGSYLGSCFSPGLGTLVGGVIGGLAGVVLGLFSGGKHRDVAARDALRAGLQKMGLVDQNFNLTLAGGSSYSIAADSGCMLDSLDGSRRHPYDVDFSNPLAGETIGWVQPLALILTGGDPKLSTDLTGYFVNAALSNAADYESARQNVLAIYNKAGIAPEGIIRALDAQRTQKNLNEDGFSAYVNGVVALLNGTLSNGKSTVEEKSAKA